MNTNHQVHLYAKGLRDVCATMRGTEVLYSGIRPYDYHPGNRVVLAAYPHQIARTVASRGVVPRFRYVITINDLEPRDYDVAALQPVGPSFQVSTDVQAIVGKLETDLVHLRREFPEIRIEYLRTSTMVDTEHFRRALELMTQEPVALLRQFFQEEYLDSLPQETVQFVGLVCPTCKVPVSVRGATPPESARCPTCGVEVRSRGPLHFWLYYIPLLALKFRVVQPDLALLGGDYVEANDASVGRYPDALAAILGCYDLIGGGRPLAFLIPPLLMGSDGQKMSKSIGNIQSYSYEEVLSASGATEGGQLVVAPRRGDAPCGP
jgi:hypothetical protein